MASSSLISRIALGLAFIAATAAGVKNYSNKEKIAQAAQENQTFKDSIANADAKVKKAADEAKAAKDELKTIANAKAAAEAKAGTAAAEIAKAKKETEAVKAQIQGKDSQIADLTKKVADAAAVVVPTAPTQDPELVKKVSDAEAKAAEKEQLLKTVQAKVEDAEKEATALKADNARRAAGLNKPGLEGKVLAVNSNWNFVVLNIGDRQGVVSGSALIVKRGGNMVAKLRVTSVEPSTSIADIQAGGAAKGFSIQPGDVVIFPGS